MKPVSASSTGTGSATVQRGFGHPISSGVPTSGPTCMQHSSLQRERVSAYTCPGWTKDACRASLTSFPKPTPTTICSSCSMVPPSHRSEEIVCPGNVDFLRLPAYSPELDPVERWFQEFRRELSNKAFKTVKLLQEALGQVLQPYWEDPSRLRRLTGFSWWVEAVNTL